MTFFVVQPISTFSRRVAKFHTAASCRSVIQLHYDVVPSQPPATPTTSKIPDVPCVMLHGLLGSRRNLRSLIKYLPFKTFILPDLRNHGRSPHSPYMPMDLMAEDLLGLLDRLEIEQASIVGHSMGEC